MLHFNAILALTLRIGVLASAALFLMGLMFPQGPWESYGVFVLIAIPILRVALSIILFAKQKNKLYIAITSIVLINLGVAILHPLLQG
jgi:uncharacterized membrane protein